MPAGVFSDVIGRTRTLFMGLAVFAVVPFAYLWVSSYEALVVVRFFHGFATAIYGPVSMAVIVSVSPGRNERRCLSWFSSITIIGNLVGAPLGGFMLTWLPAGSGSESNPFPYGVWSRSRFGDGFPLDCAVGHAGKWDSPKHENGRTLGAVWAQFSNRISGNLDGPQSAAHQQCGGVPKPFGRGAGGFLPIYAVMICGFGIPGGPTLGSPGCLHRSIQAYHGENLGSAWSPKPLFWGMFVCAVPFVLIPWFQSFGALLLPSPRSSD